MATGERAMEQDELLQTYPQPFAHCVHYYALCVGGGGVGTSAVPITSEKQSKSLLILLENLSLDIT